MNNQWSVETFQRSVLLVTDNLKVGGVQAVVVRLAKSLVARGYRVGVAASSEGDLWDSLPEGCRLHPFPEGTGKVKLTYWLRQLVLKQNYDIVHAHQRGIALLARIALIGQHPRLVEHVHNVFLPASQRFLSFRGHHLIACGSEVETMLVDVYGRPPSRISVVMNGVPDMLKDISKEQNELENGSSVINIVAVARASEQKNPLKFIEVIHALGQLGYPVEAEWVGEGELLDASRKRIQDLQLTNVCFSGSSRDVPAKLKKADVLLLTSKWEGLPLVVLEAMSLGVGCILPDVGSCRDAVGEGNGYLYSPDDDARAIASKIGPMLNRTNLQHWSRASRARYQERFTLNRMVVEIQDVYRLVTKEHGE